MSFIIKIHSCFSCQKISSKPKSITKCWKQKIYERWMLPKKEMQTNKNKAQSPQNPREGKSYQTGSTVFFPSSLTDTFPLLRLSSSSVSPLAFPSSGVCLVDVPQLFHIIWTTWGTECEAFCKSFVTTIRYGLQNSSAETCVSSQASEWELMFK